MLLMYFHLTSSESAPHLYFNLGQSHNEVAGNKLPETGRSAKMTTILRGKGSEAALLTNQSLQISTKLYAVVSKNS